MGKRTQRRTQRRTQSKINRRIRGTKRRKTRRTRNQSGGSVKNPLHSVPISADDGTAIRVDRDRAGNERITRMVESMKRDILETLEKPDLSFELLQKIHKYIKSQYDITTRVERAIAAEKN